MAKEHRSKGTESKRKRSEEAADSSADESVTSRRSSKSSKDRKKEKSRKPSRRDDDSGAESSASSTSMSSVSSMASSSSSRKKSSKRKSTSSSELSASTTFLRDQPVTSAFELQYPILTAPLPPIHSAEPIMAVVELLDSLIMRFVPPLNGVLVSHGQIYFLTEAGSQSASAIIDADSAFAKARVAVECCVWRPKIGAKLQGHITLQTPSHVSLLVHSTFNASIPKSHLEERYEYVEGAGHSGEEAVEEEQGAEDLDNGGHWRHKETGQPLGASTGGRIDFIVVSLTISGHSLSLGGSLLSRPFSVAPSHGATAQTLQEQLGTTAQRAARFGFTDATAKKSGRRVRWEGDDDSESGSDDEGRPTTPGKPEIKASSSHVKFS